MKKIILLVMLLLLTGCGGQGTFDAKIKKMQKRLNHTDGKYEVVDNPQYENIKSNDTDNKEAILTIDTGGHTSQVNSMILDNNSNELITGSEDKTIRIWDIKTGKIKRKILGYISDDFHGMDGMISYMSLSPNKKYLAVLAGHGGIRIYDYKQGKLIVFLKTDEKALQLNVKFSDDGKYLISPSQTSGNIYIWKVSDFSLVKIIKYHEAVGINVEMYKTSDDYNIVSSDIVQVCIHSLKHKALRKCHRSKRHLMDLAISDDLIALSTSKDNKILIFDKKLNLQNFIKNDTAGAIIKFSSDGKYLLSSTDLKSEYFNVYDAANKYEKVQSFFSPSTYTMDFLDNNRIVSISNDTFDIKIWDIKSGKQIDKFFKISNQIVKVGLKGKVVSIENKNKDKKSINLTTNQFSKDFIPIQNITTKYDKYSLKYIRSNKNNTRVNKITINKDNEELASIKMSTSLAYLYTISGKYIFINHYNGGGIIYVYNYQGEQITTLEGHNGLVNSMSIDGNSLLTQGRSGIIKLWNLDILESYKAEVDYEFLEKIRKINIKNTGLPWDIGDVKASLDDKGMRSRYMTQPTINPIVSLFVAKGSESIIWTDEGFFNASRGASKFVGFHINQGKYKEAEYISVDELYSTFYRPDLIQKALAGESLEKYAKNINIQKLLKDGLAPEVHILTKTKNTKIQDLDLKVQVCPKQKGGYDNLTLLINNMPVSVIDTSRALKLKKRSSRDDCFIYNQTISLAGGVNDIGFRATNKAGNIESKPDFLQVTFDDTNLKKKLRTKLAKISGEQNINDLHILAIAVNEYKDRELTLKYSINDATVMLSTIQDVATPLFNKVHTYKLFDKQVTKEKIKQAFKDIKSTREDVFLLYIAGHGITDEYNGNYYYIPYDFINKNDDKAVQSQGVGQRDLMLGLSNITALKSLVLLDTCNSGSFVEADMQKTTTNRLARATGRATISASSKSQVALEGYKGHGVFTYTLIEALNGKGYNKNNKITINNLNDYVEEILPDRTNQKWGYRQMPQSSMYGVDFNIGAK